MSPSYNPSSIAGSTEFSSSPLSLLQPGSRSNSGLGQRDSRNSNELEVCNTDTMKALRDVELAVDEHMLSRAQRSSAEPRRMSANPRIADVENPFIDISARLASRRVRPMVIELIQALGHYVDAVWCLRYPDRPCPWVSEGSSISGRPSLSSKQASGEKTATMNIKASEERAWTSRMITAVQEGKASGHVNDPPTGKDARFWQAEVTYSLRDVDEVVGIYKGAMWAFNKAIVAGRYGEVDDGNVLGTDGQGGNIARLLNDLEEAIWSVCVTCTCVALTLRGDAPPRVTDLAYELPIDFDPYAIPTEMDLGSGGGAGGGLASFFSDSRGSQCHHATPVTDEIYEIPLLDPQHDADGSASPTRVSSVRTHTPIMKPSADPLELQAFKIEGRELTLEEIGRKRHQEWLASKNAQW